MKKTIIGLVFISLFLSCGTEKTALEMKKGETREDTGLFVISESTKGYWFYGVNKRKSKIEREYSFVTNDRVIFSLYRISEPASNLRRIKILEDLDEIRYVWVRLTFHAKKDMKGRYFKKGSSDFHRYRTLDFSGFSNIEIDSIQVLDKAKEKIYQQTMDSLTKANAPDILYGW